MGAALALMDTRDADGPCPIGAHYQDASGVTYWVSGIMQLDSAADPTLDSGAATDFYKIRPNPFTGVMNMRYAVTANPGVVVKIAIYNISGRRIRGLFTRFQSTGTYEISRD